MQSCHELGTPGVPFRFRSDHGWNLANLFIFNGVDEGAIVHPNREHSA